MINILIKINCNVFYFTIYLQNLKIFTSIVHLLDLTYSLCSFNILKMICKCF